MLTYFAPRPSPAAGGAGAGPAARRPPGRLTHGLRSGTWGVAPPGMRTGSRWHPTRTTRLRSIRGARTRRRRRPALRAAARRRRRQHADGRDLAPLRDRILLLGQQVDDEIEPDRRAAAVPRQRGRREGRHAVHQQPGGSVSAGMAMFHHAVRAVARAHSTRTTARAARPPPVLPCTPSPSPSMLPPSRARAPAARRAAPRRRHQHRLLGTAASMGAFLLGAGCGRSAAACQTRGSIHQPLGGAQGQVRPPRAEGRGRERVAGGLPGARARGRARAARGRRRPREAALAAVAHAARSRAHAPSRRH